MGLYKVTLYNALREAIKVVRIHAPHWVDAPTVALKRFPNEGATSASVRIR